MEGKKEGRGERRKEKTRRKGKNNIKISVGQNRLRKCTMEEGRRTCGPRT